ncbi:MAG: type II toxin-antitoxin system VapC family toxin [Candidatus Devosia phytovorans]|uniref:Ribonuclease VapC n=1 Tax=Candidatus Devosia phytovorans TaxID=3121372 RepID=A0AAJ5VWK0_9HYPH|nr:type II toxin-antitoxin system VapC family toxin [Devosia sp.]WEK05416.1 MAG: type II toxin-antitoxin system VapC family toxin [Devosia sp.]
MFVDASAIVALFSKEQEQSRVDDILGSTVGSFTSPLAVLESVLALSRPDKWNVPVDEAALSLVQLMRARDIVIRDVDNPSEVVHLASFAAARFRSGRRGLNLADCMHYASAKYYKVPILATANEFRQTDLDVVP